MFPPREIAQNYLMGLGPIRSFAEKRHQTGRGQDPVEVSGATSWLESSANVAMDIADVLEVGPGRGLVSMQALAPLAASYSAFDTRPYLDRSDLDAIGVDYRTESGGRFPWEAESFDLVWSRSVLEHVRHPELTVREMKRVLRFGGRMVAEIDLEDHYKDRSHAEGVFAFMQYPEWLWNAMTSNRSSYCNRLRASGWVDVIQDSGMSLVAIETFPPAPKLDELKAVPYLRELPDADLLAGTIRLVCEKVHT